MTNPLLNLYSAFFQKYGVALRAQARFQMNVIVEKNDTFNWFKDIQDDVVYLPIMWLDEGISGPSKVRFINIIISKGAILTSATVPWHGLICCPAPKVSTYIGIGHPEKKTP